VRSYDQSWKSLLALLEYEREMADHQLHYRSSQGSGRTNASHTLHLDKRRSNLGPAVAGVGLLDDTDLKITLPDRVIRMADTQNSSSSCLMMTPERSTFGCESE
jgi:hypothetical protein